jgi:hypothetical protein
MAATTRGSTPVAIVRDERVRVALDRALFFEFACAFALAFAARDAAVAVRVARAGLLAVERLERFFAFVFAFATVPQ